MQNEVTEYIDGIGNVDFVRSKKAKRINIRVKPDASIRVAVPRNASMKQARSFLLQKEEWVKKNVNRVRSSQKDQLINEESMQGTRFHSLKIIRTGQSNLKAQIGNNFIRIYLPLNVSVDNEQVQLFIRKSLIETLRLEARQVLPQKVKELANEHGFKYNDLRLKNIKSRWGSCSAKNNINLSIHLMMLPDHLIDFIILHELCHTIHKNHGSEFKSLLQKISGNRLKMEKELKNYRIWLK